MSEQKIIEPTKITEHLKNIRHGKKIVFTNGCFDLFHYGHLAYLKEAKELGDLLVVALNSDKSIQKIKGEKRPWMPLQHRLAILAAFEFIDWVSWFETENPIPLILDLKPEILVKGGDYSVEQVVGQKEVIQYGGMVEVVGYQKDLSSTALFQKIMQF